MPAASSTTVCAIDHHSTRAFVDSLVSRKRSSRTYNTSTHSQHTRGAAWSESHCTQGGQSNAHTQAWSLMVCCPTHPLIILLRTNRSNLVVELAHLHLDGCDPPHTPQTHAEEQGRMSKTGSSSTSMTCPRNELARQWRMGRRTAEMLLLGNLAIILRILANIQL